MKDSIRNKLEGLEERLEELGGLLSEPGAAGNSERFAALSREYAQLEPVVAAFRDYQAREADLAEATAMLAEEADAEMRALAEEERDRAREALDRQELELKKFLIPRDPHDQANVYLEVRAGTGGQEAALFAGDLYRMYTRYAESRGWQTEIVSDSEGDAGGYKEVIVQISGRDVYSRLKFESGTHRVQRVPETESQGRIHTSACTVAVLPEAEELGEVTLDSNDLRVDTFRSSGAGGQHVNKTDSAIRITHLPTGIVVESQSERSQHKNRAKAMAFLKARIQEQERTRQVSERAENRRLQVGSGDRSERIRTYNFPQGRVTDHRINLTLYKLDDVLAGNLDEVIEPLISEHQAEQLAELAG